MSLCPAGPPTPRPGIASSLRNWYASLTPRGQSITLSIILAVTVFYIPGLWLLKLLFAVYLFLAKEPIFPVGKGQGWKRDTRATKWTHRTEQSLVAALQVRIYREEASDKRMPELMSSTSSFSTGYTRSLQSGQRRTFIIYL